MSELRLIFIGILIGIGFSWLIGDEPIGFFICILFIILNELFDKFFLTRDPE